MKKNYIFAFILILGAIFYLAFSTLSENKVYFVTVSEALNMGLDKLNQARLFGIVGKKGLKRSHGGLETFFYLLDRTDKHKSIPVFYKGALSDTFKPGVEVIVEGRMKPEYFQASLIITKCPSKYKNK
ncbi:cytochrome c maturation protein CcmE [Desulfonauticus submarinus]